MSEGASDGGAREQRMGRPSLEKTEEIGRTIREQTTEIYLRAGMAVTMKAIVQATGLSSKTVYARYPNKDALFLAMLRFLFRKAKPPMDLSQVADGGAVYSALREFIRLSIEAAYRLESMALHRLLTADRHFGRQLNPDLFQTLDRMLIEPLSIFLERSRVAGWIRDMDAARAARSLNTLILAEPASRHADQRPTPGEAEIADRADYIATLFFHGAKPASPAG